MRLALALLLTAATASAQAPADSVDARLSTAFDALGYAYDVDADGLYSLTFALGDPDDPETRTQTVYVRSTTSVFDGFEVREVYTIASGAGDPVAPKLALRLLDENATMAFGAWGTEDGAVLLIVALDADASPDEVGTVIDLAAGTADALEAELSDTDEW